LAAKVGGSVSLNKDLRPKAWKDIWGAGQGVGAIDTIMSVRELVDQLIAEYEQAKRDVLR
jgi:nitronate monooxygenase